MTHLARLEQENLDLKRLLSAAVHANRGRLEVTDQHLRLCSPNIQIWRDPVSLTVVVTNG